MNAVYLADTSALNRRNHPDVGARMTPLIESGLVATCTVVDLEVLYSARSAPDHAQMRADRAGYERAPITEVVMQRAVDVQSRLADRGRHRLPIQDLIIAAAAESQGLVLLHYDADFERIAQVTFQTQQWVVPRGSI